MPKICPKCKDRGLYETTEMSLPSSLERHQETTTPFVSVIKCIYCGWRNELVQEDNRPLPIPKTAKRSAKPEEYAALVRANWELIQKARRHGVNWVYIAEDLKTEKLPITPNTLRKLSQAEAHRLACLPEDQ